MLKTVLTIFFFLASGSSWARITDGHVHTSLDNKENPKQITITTDKGFHLNLEAPTGIFFDNQRALFPPVTKTEEKFVFNVPEKVKKAEASVFVCDDKKTACEKQILNIALSTDNKSNQSSQHTTMMNEAETQAPATISNKPRLLVFTAPWCPACIRMESETYNQKSFQKLTKKIQFEKHNIDLPENYTLSEQFQVKAIPTLILLNEKGEQIGRWLDFTEASVLTKEISTSLKQKENTLQALEEKAKNNDQAAILKLAVDASKNYNCEDAEKWWSSYKGSEENNIRVAINVECANMKAQEDNKNDMNYIQALEKGALLTTSEYDQTRWLVDWMDKKKETNQLTADIKGKALELAKTIQTAIKNKKSLASFYKNTSIESPTGFEKEELLAIQAKIYGLIDQTEDQKKSEIALEKSLQAKNLSVEKPGQLLNALGYYNEIKNNDIVENNFKKLITRYPNTYVYYSKLSGFYFRNKNFPEALKYADLALQKAEGNEPQLRFQKAKILKELNQKSEATAELDKIMSDKQIQHPKYKKLSVQANDLKEKLKTNK